MPKGQLLTEAQVLEIYRLRSAGMNVVEIASRVGVSTRTVSRMAPPPNTEWGSGRTRILRAVAENGPLGMSELAGLVPDVDRHNIMHLLYSMNRLGLVSYNESRNGTMKSLSRIACTEVGFKEAGVPSKIWAAEVGHSNRAPSLHPGDGTDFRNQSPRAHGGPIAISHVPPVAAPQPPTAPEAPPPGPRVRYPLIAALSDRRGRIEEAARLLEAAGQDDLALTVLAKADEYTPLEREALAAYLALKEIGLTE